ncbi:MAG: deoxyribose-phosphate aldolase, partial [Alsobacter sp.]
IATVMNFPSGTADLEAVLDDMEEALDDGADEIDLVFPYRDFLAGDEDAAVEMVREARGLLQGNQQLKVILETGALPDMAAVSRASGLAIAAGADFLKTSTGKIAVSATADASRAMLEAIRDSGRPVGFKAAGGIRTLADAMLYLALAETVMGSGWAKPETFRIGASSLHAALVAAIDGAGSAPAPQGY